ncbi:hypothetical protein [Bacillus sp. UNC438CL73TsuS30]|uniref:hypothetical protein n=1 Tax=Bacillus sp. UNC438CL73TsuS30 TaxID=1340434 RepID=UPI00047D0526|nr:hypothetical protein [Bacillus sp. UNC438CL73TsuS30]
MIGKKHEVSQKSLKTLEKVMFSQDDYGFEKYKKPLSHEMNYDWMQMFLEEMADGLKYIQNEMDRKAKVIELLENALKLESMILVESALGILKIEGTGK